MLKITYCMRRLPHLSREEFQTYYRRKHTRVLSQEDAAKLQMRRYVQLHALEEETCHALDMDRGGEPSFDALAEIWLDDYEAWEQHWNSEEGHAVLRQLMDDENNFIDWSRSVMTCSRELVLIDGPSTPGRG
jgi:uncharacterized protein (TIGR02118 family)